MSSVEFGDVYRAARLVGTRPATFMRDAALGAAREVIKRDTDCRHRR